MKKSAQVTLTVVAVVGMASCGRTHPDPCQSATFNEQACQDAVRSGGYYHHGSWVPMVYGYPYPYYYDSYRGFVSRGGAARPEPSNAYGRPGAASGVERGGFGATGEGHAAGAGE